MGQVDLCLVALFRLVTMHVTEEGLPRSRAVKLAFKVAGQICNISTYKEIYTSYS